MQLKNVRFIIAAITTFSAYSVYVSRVNLSIAIIAMVDDGHGLNQTLEMSTATQLPRPMPNASATGDGISSSSPIIKANNQGAGTSPAGSSASHQSVINSATSNTQAVVMDNTKLPRQPLTTVFPASKETVKMPLINQEKFHWDQIEQGHILGAFFYGYILIQIPGARLAESVGAKWIIMAANAGSALISLLFPLSTQLNSIHLLMVLRFVMGLCQSAFFPAAYVLFCRWLPESERSILLPIMFIGSSMGSISTYVMASYLISSSYGWPSVFHVSGAICALVTLLWCVFGSSEPRDNWLISEEECNYIEGNVFCDKSSELNSFSVAAEISSPRRGSLRERSNSLIATVGKAIPLDKSHIAAAAAATKNAASPQRDSIKLEASNNLKSSGSNNNDVEQEKREQRLLMADGAVVSDELSSSSTTTMPSASRQFSWSKLLTSVPLWTLIWSMYGNEWSHSVLCYELPTYLNTALNIPIEQNGVINSFFQLSYALMSPVMSSLGAYMLARHVFGMRKIHVRKLFQSMALFGQMSCFISVPICGPNRGLIIMFMFSAIVFKSCANAGDIMVPGDLSPDYAGTIFAFANSIGNTAGVFVPLLAGSFVNDAHDRNQWTPFWLTTAAIMGTSGLIFLVFGKTTQQDFTVNKNEKQHDETTRKATNGIVGTAAAAAAAASDCPELPQCCQKLV